MGKIAVVFGASGLVGSHLLEQLANNADYSEIVVFNRRSIAYQSKKIREVVCKPEEIAQFKNEIQGDVLFCALGTTIKKAGSVSAFKKIDYDYVVNAAKLAKENGIPAFIVVSSIGTKKSANYYLQTKYEMEQAIQALNFGQLAILRPSLLLGKRNETRLAESLASKIYPAFDFILKGSLKKYRAIKAETVARAMIKIAENQTLTGIFESDRIEDLGK